MNTKTGNVSTLELCFKIFESFPYPIQVYSPDGTSAMINKALLDEFDISDRNMIIGKYNIYKDPMIIQNGLADYVSLAFSGETIHLKKLEVPVRSIKDSYKTESHYIDVMYQDATLFPIFEDEDDNKVLYVVVVLVTKRIHKGKDSIIRAKEFFKANWQEKFDIKKAASEVNLSPYYFSRLFKREVGITPYNYYLDIKIEKIKEKLCDGNLTISEAFAACGMDYHGNAAKLFKRKVGFTPSEFRRRKINS